MEEYAHHQERVEEILHSSMDFHQAVSEFVLRRGLVSRLFESADGEKSVAELMSELAEAGEEDIPLTELMEEVQKEAPDEQKAQEAYTRLITEAPAKVIEHAKADMERRAERRRSYGDV
ncbi:MAG: hypothetical protein E7211_21855 [Clostridium lundense]|nr:hypothetical protein [Clostridium lundense]